MSSPIGARRGRRASVARASAGSAVPEVASTGARNKEGAQVKPKDAAADKVKDLDEAWRLQYLDPKLVGGKTASTLLDKFFAMQEHKYEAEEHRLTVREWLMSRSMSHVKVPHNNPMIRVTSRLRWKLVQSYVLRRDCVTLYLEAVLTSKAALIQSVTKTKKLDTAMRVIKKKGVAPPIPPAKPPLFTSPEVAYKQLLHYKKAVADHLMSEWEAPYGTPEDCLYLYRSNVDASSQRRGGAAGKSTRSNKYASGPVGSRTASAGFWSSVSHRATAGGPDGHLQTVDTDLFFSNSIGDDAGDDAPLLSFAAPIDSLTSDQREALEGEEKRRRMKLFDMYNFSKQDPVFTRATNPFTSSSIHSVLLGDRKKVDEADWAFAQVVRFEEFYLMPPRKGRKYIPSVQRRQSKSLKDDGGNPAYDLLFGANAGPAITKIKAGDETYAFREGLPRMLMFSEEDDVESFVTGSPKKKAGATKRVQTEGRYYCSHLRLNNNKLSSFDNFNVFLHNRIVSPNAIIMLDLSENMFTTLPANLATLVPSLEIFFFHGNDLRDFDELDKLAPRARHIHTLSLHGNSIEKTDKVVYRWRVMSMFQRLKTLDHVTLLESDWENVRPPPEIPPLDPSSPSKNKSIVSRLRKATTSTSPTPGA